MSRVHASTLHLARNKGEAFQNGASFLRAEVEFITVLGSTTLNTFRPLFKVGPGGIVSERPVCRRTSKVLRKYLFKSRRRNSMPGAAADSAAAASGTDQKHPYWQQLLTVCQALDQPTGSRSAESVDNACAALRDVQFFGCARRDPRCM